MKKMFFAALLMLMSVTVFAQNKYIVKTKGAVKTEAVEEQTKEENKEEEKPDDFVSKYFRFISPCDWKEGMRFMVVPGRQDMLIKTFTDSLTGKMVSSLQLKHMVMVYTGHDNKGGLHDHMNFRCEDNGRTYYYEIPSLSFYDYCASKRGVPTLAYLGDVDTAIAQLMDKDLFTTSEIFYEDTEYDGDGVKELKVPLNTQVKVVAIGVGTREFPVKIIVADEDGREFFQNIAFSRTNSGLRDDEFALDNLKHTFAGSFDLPTDNLAVLTGYKKFIGQDVYTLYRTKMTDETNTRVDIDRLTCFRVRDIQQQRGTKWFTMTLMNNRTKRIFSKDVVFLEEDKASNLSGRPADYFHDLFVKGDPAQIPGVRTMVMHDIQQGKVLAGFTEAEVRLSLGEPSSKTGTDKKGLYTWVYNYPGKDYICVWFKAKEKTVTRVIRN